MTCFRSGNTGSEKIRQRWLVARSLSLNQQQSRHIQSSTSAFCNEEQSVADNGFIYPNLLFLSAPRNRAGIHPHAHSCTSWFCLWKHTVSTHINKHKFLKKRWKQVCSKSHASICVLQCSTLFARYTDLNRAVQSQTVCCRFAGTGSDGSQPSSRCILGIFTTLSKTLSTDLTLRNVLQWRQQFIT